LPRALALALCAAACKYSFLKDLLKLDCAPSRIYGFLKNLAKKPLIWA
jgi:hypothetical protein